MKLAANKQICAQWKSGALLSFKKWVDELIATKC